MIKKVFQILLVVGCLVAMLLVGGCSFMWWGAGQATPRNANIKIDLRSSQQDKLKQIETRVYRFVHVKVTNQYIDVTIVDDGAKGQSSFQFNHVTSARGFTQIDTSLELIQEVRAQLKVLPKYAVVD